MAETKYKMSQARYDELTRELEYMQTVREKEVAELIKEARSYGDLSENSEYDEAKTEQAKLYTKIADYKNMLDNAEIVENTTNTGVVGIGSKVTVRDVEYDEVEIYQNVGSQEVDPAQGRISDDSPLGKGLVGHKIGEVVIVEAPVGDLQFEIMDVTV